MMAPPFLSLPPAHYHTHTVTPGTLAHTHSHGTLHTASHTTAAAAFIIRTALVCQGWYLDTILALPRIEAHS